MPDIKVISNRRIGWFFGPETSIADWEKPSLANAQTLANWSAALRIAGTDFGIQATALTDDRSFADEAGAQDFGYPAFGGNVSNFIPPNNEVGTVLRAAMDTFEKPRTRLAVMQRFGILESTPLAAGQEVNVFRVITDAESKERRETGYSLTTELKSQDDVLVNYILPPAVPVAVTVAGTTTTPTGVIGTTHQLDAMYQGHRITAGATWSSANSAIAEVNAAGVVLFNGAGTAVITAAYPGGTAGTITVTGTAS